MVMPPPNAVTVSVEAPAAAVEAAESDNVAMPAPGAAMLRGAKLPETPAGRPLTENDIAELNPFTLVVVNVAEVEPPAARLALGAPGVSVKPMGCNTVRLNA